MSTLLEIKGLIFSNLFIVGKDGDQDIELKKAIFDLFEAIDGDLDEQMYSPSGETEGRLEQLNNILSSSVDEDNKHNNEEEEDNIITEEDKPLAEEVEDEVDINIYKETSTEENETQ